MAFQIIILLLKSLPFEKHTNESIKLSQVGLDITINHKDWFSYRKSLKPKTDYSKWIGIGIALVSFGWNIYQSSTNNGLRCEIMLKLNHLFN